MKKLFFFLIFVTLSFNLVLAADLKLNLEVNPLNPIIGQEVIVNVYIEADGLDYPLEILAPYILIESSDQENSILDLNGGTDMKGNIYDSLSQNKIHSGFISNGKSYVWKMSGKPIVQEITAENNLLGSFKMNAVGEGPVSFSIKTPQSYIEKSDGTSYNVDFTDTAVVGEEGDVQSDNCQPDWQCLEWSVCSENKQTRSCTDANECNSESLTTIEEKDCTDVNGGDEFECVDTDGGKDYFVKGTITSNAPGTVFGKIDKCAIDNNMVESCDGEDCKLVEIYCIENGYDSEFYQCLNGCQDGACIEIEDELKVDGETCQSNGECQNNQCIGTQGIYHETYTQSVDLANYPNFFVDDDGKFNGYMVTGENSDSENNLAAIDIASSMKYVNKDGELDQVQFMDVTKLDSQIDDITAKNLIVIGNPCVNTVTKELLGNPTDCTEGFKPGQAKIRLYEHANGNLAMLVAGYSDQDTMLAGQVIAHRADDLSGNDLEIEGTTYSDSSIGSASWSKLTNVCCSGDKCAATTNFGDGTCVNSGVVAEGEICENGVWVTQLECQSNGECESGICTWENKCFEEVEDLFFNQMGDFEISHPQEVQDANQNGWNINIITMLAHFFKTLFL